MIQPWAATVQRPWAAATGDFTQISHDECFVTFFVEAISFNFVEKVFFGGFYPSIPVIGVHILIDAQGIGTVFHFILVQDLFCHFNQ